MPTRTQNSALRFKAILVHFINLNDTRVRTLFLVLGVVRCLFQENSLRLFLIVVRAPSRLIVCVK